jgi:hypothetical protein
MHRPPALAERRSNCFAAGSVIAEDRLAADAAIQDVVDRAGIFDSRLARHRSSF